MPNLWTKKGARLFAGNLRAAFSQQFLMIFPPAIAFNLLACAVPFLLVLFSVFGRLVEDPAAYRSLLDFLISQLPDIVVRKGTDFLSRSEVNASLTLLLAHRRAALIAGTSILAFTASSLMQTLRIALSAVFGVRKRLHPVRARLHGLLLFGLLGEALLVVAAALWGLSMLRPFIYESLGGRSPALAALFRAVLRAVTVAGDLGIIYGVYLLLPDSRPSKRAAGAASLLFLTLWQAARVLVGIYFRYTLPRYSLLYGTYSAVVILGLWLYYSAFMFIWSAAAGRAYAETTAGPAAD